MYTKFLPKLLNDPSLKIGIKGLPFEACPVIVNVPITDNLVLVVIVTVELPPFDNPTTLTTAILGVVAEGIILTLPTVADAVHV